MHASSVHYVTRTLNVNTNHCKVLNKSFNLQIVDATPLVDLSPIYGNTVEKARRTNSGGKLVTVTNNNRIYFPDTCKYTL